MKSWHRGKVLWFYLKHFHKPIIYQVLDNQQNSLLCPWFGNRFCKYLSSSEHCGIRKHWYDHSFDKNPNFTFYFVLQFYSFLKNLNIYFILFLGLLMSFFIQMFSFQCRKMDSRIVLCIILFHLHRNIIISRFSHWFLTFWTFRVISLRNVLFATRYFSLI